MPEACCLAKDCGQCPDRALCDTVDSSDVEFWPEQGRLEEVSRRFGEAVLQTDYTRVRECLLTGTWVPGETGCCGTAVTKSDDRVCGKPAGPSSTMYASDAQGGMNQMVKVFPPVLQEKLGDDGARALLQLLEEAASAKGAEESAARGIQQHVDRVLTLLEDRVKGFIVTVTAVSLLVLAVLMLTFQMGQAIIAGT